MQQRQLRLGDVLDDYCPRERRLTNHVVVAMIGDDVKQTRCTTCDAEHEYKQAKLPRLRRKTESPAALAAQGFGPPKLHDHVSRPAHDEEPAVTATPEAPGAHFDDDTLAAAPETEDAGHETDMEPQPADEGPVHRRLIRASLPRIEGQAPPTRPNPEFTIRQPNNRQNRFRPRQGRGGPMQANGNRSFGGGYPQQQQRQHGGHQRRRNRSK
ncbi:MAG TPA: hypothetical protein VG871_23285 [Vicinamibacterales bacterium]|nr:hypothetical protein [Vicinamibacterales bacterium]